MLEMNLHSKKLRYDRLFNVIKDYISRSTTEYDTVNIFIDLYDVVKQLYKPQIIEEIESMKSIYRWQICSEIINIAGHYRHFFASRMNKYTNIYFFYSSNPDSEYGKDFRKEFNDKRFSKTNTEYSIINKVIQENFKLIQKFFEYIPHCYVINSYIVDYTLVPYIILNHDDDGLASYPTIILSNEEIYFQDLCNFENCMQLLLKGEKSRIVTRENLWDEIILSTKKKDMEISMIPEMYTLLLSIIGYKLFSLPKIKNYGVIKGLNLLQNLIDKGVLSEIDYDERTLMSDLSTKCELTQDEIDIIVKNFKILNHSNYNTFGDYIQKILIQSRIERINKDVIQKINEKYFSHFPILMEYLFDGESYE
jgi:hypothetical protein